VFNFKSFLLACVLAFLSNSAVEPPPKAEPIVILGGGVGSLTSAIYLGRAGLSPLVIEGPNPGGLLTQSHAVQNWPGELEIQGAELTEKMRKQAEANGARFLGEEVVAINFSKKPYEITTRALDGTQKTHIIRAESCIIAMGTKPNFLGIPGEQDYWGKGVTNCAICDGALYKDKVVGVVGGGDAAVLEALYLSNIAKEVHVFVRKESLKATEERRVKTLLEKPNVKFHYKSTVEQVMGDGQSVTGLSVNKGGKRVSFPVEGLFLAIGSTPNSALFKNALNLDPQGYIVLTKDQQTSLPGVYAIGDIVDPIYKQAVSAAGDGSKAALQAQQYLSDRANKLVASNNSVKKKTAPATSTVIEIQSNDQFKRELEMSDVPIVADFYATWCGPCKRAAPVLDEAAKDLAGKVKFIKVNVDKFPELSTTYEIKAMPTVLLLNSTGAELQRKVGLDQINELLAELRSDYK
jgi:thioredoxin reductase (NADPH)